MGIAGEIAENLRDARDSIADTVGDVAKEVAEQVDDFVEDAADVVSEIGEEFREGFQAGTEALKPIVEEAWEKGVKIPLDNAIEKIKDIGEIVLDIQEQAQEILDAIGQKLLEELLEYLSTLSIVVEFKTKGYARVQVSTSLFNYDVEFDVCKGFTYQFELLDWTKVYLFYNFDNGLITFEVKIHDKVITKNWVKLKFAIPATPVPTMMLKQCEVEEEDEEEDDGPKDKSKGLVCFNGQLQPLRKLPESIPRTQYDLYVSKDYVDQVRNYRDGKLVYHWKKSTKPIPLYLWYEKDTDYYYQRGWRLQLFASKIIEIFDADDPSRTGGDESYETYAKLDFDFTSSQIKKQVEAAHSLNRDYLQSSFTDSTRGYLRDYTIHVFSKEWATKGNRNAKCNVTGKTPDVPPIKPMDDQCCSMIRQILDRLGGDDWDAIIPKSLTDGKDSTEKVSTIPDMMAKTIEYQDELAGSYPVEIQIEDSDLTQEGNQTISLEFPNQAEFLAEMYGMMYELMKNLTVTQELAFKAMTIAGLNQQALIKTRAQVETIQDYLDFSVNEREKEYKWLFTPGEQDWDKILEETDFKVKTQEYDDDEQTLKSQLIELMQGAAVIRARYFRQVGNDFDFMKIIKQGASLGADFLESKQGEKKDKKWEDWKDFIEDDLMKKYEEGNVKPDIKDLNNNGN